MAQSIYGPLDDSKKEIRLVKLAAGSENNLLPHCVLVTASLDDKIEYTALSYTWGNVKDTVPVKLNGQWFAVTQNLALALSHLQGTHGDRFFWIDAISIDQSNVSERNLQVSQMHQIYGKANEVLVWLGPAMNNSDLVMDAIETLGTFPTIHWWYLNSRSGPHLAVFNSKYAELKWPWELYEFISNPWWLRVWTLQEAVLASNLNFLCGHRVLSGEILFSCIQNHNNHATSCCSSIYSFQHPESNFINKVAYVRRNRERQQGASSLLDLLNTHRFRQCHDSRDKLYGLLGLVAYHNIPASINVDYNLSTAQTFTNFAMDELIRMKNCRILSFILPLLPDTDVPSWAPDWTAQADDAHIDVLTYRSHALQYFNATKDQLLKAEVIENKILVIDGAIMDTIVSVGAVDNVSVFAGRTLRRWWYQLGLNRSPKAAYPVGGTLEDAWWQLLMSHSWHREPYDKPVPWRVKQDFIRRDGFGSRNPLRMLQTASFPLADQIISHTKGKVGEYHGRNSHFVTFMRRLAITSKGYVGLVPANAEPGDRVALLFGGRVPYILRKSQQKICERDGVRYECHYILGDSVIIGLMMGEGLKLVEERVVERANLCLV